MSKKLPARSEAAPPPPADSVAMGEESDLPEGWAVASLESLTSFTLGGDWGHDVDEVDPEYTPVRVVRGTEFRNWEGCRASTAAQRSVKKSSLEKRRLGVGDIVVEVSGGGPSQPVGRSVLIDSAAIESSDTPLVCSNFFRLMRLHTEVAPSFVNSFINYSVRRGDFDEFQTQTTNLRNLNFTAYLTKTEVPLPPLAEQGRIVGKLEAVLGKVAACQGRLARVPGLLKRFRQSVLAAACSGKLTADWREENPCELPYDQSLIKESLDDSDVPWNWGQTSLGPLIELVTSGSRGWAEYYSDAGSVFIRAQNINRDVLDLEDIAFVKLPNKAEGLRTRVQQHDILITITGANVTKSALVEHQLDDAYVSQHVALVRLKDQRLSQFLFHWIVSVAHGRKQLQVSAYGQGKPGLNLDNIRDVAVALPPLAEQHEIVRRVEQLFALADRLEAQLDAARKRVDRLTQSVLAKAFRGELVPTEADLARREGRPYEPARELLARIREHQTATKPTQAPRKPRKGDA